MSKKTGFRWRVRGFDVKSCEEFVNKCINEEYDVCILEGVLNDNYLIHDIVFEWFEWEKRHKVKFDYLILRERNDHYLTSFEMIGTKERGMTEDEEKLLESFLEEYEEQEEERERWYNESKKEKQKVVD